MLRQPLRAYSFIILEISGAALYKSLQRYRNSVCVRMIPVSPTASRGHGAAVDTFNSNSCNAGIPVLHCQRGYLNDNCTSKFLAITRE